MTRQARRLCEIAWLAVAASAMAACHAQALPPDGGSPPGPGLGGAGGGDLGAAGFGGTGTGAAAGDGGAAGGVDAGVSDGGFAADFAARAAPALAAGAPPGTCATTLPTVPVADASAARDVIRNFIAGVVGVPAADLAIVEGPCNLPSTTTCALRFSHDCAKSGGAIYDTVLPFAEELDANAGSVEETIWAPPSMTGDVVLSGISEGLLVGMVVFNAAYACH